MKNKLINLSLLFLFFIGLSVMLYPTISDYWNSKTQSAAIIDYEKTVSAMEPEDYSAYFEAADKYNNELLGLDYPLMQSDSINGYDDILNVNGDGMMGYITISQIKVELPIYHGTEKSVLNIATGHLKGSSFPIGGQSTHAILSAHRGLPSAKLFTDLDKLEVGDTFDVTILDRVTTYEIDQIRIVEPNEVDELFIEDGKEYCTLLTCTPYGINTHRLLVRGHRVDTSGQKAAYITTEAYQVDTMIVALVVGISILVILMFFVFFSPNSKKKANKNKKN